MRAAENPHPLRRDYRPRFRSHTWRPQAKRGLTLAFFTLIAWLLIEHARDIEWPEVGKALLQLPNTVLLIAMALAMLSFLIYTTFDLMGRHYTRHTMPAGNVMQIAFISYAFNLNLGSLVGGIAFRYRLYSKFGLDNDVITRVLGLSMLTNWLGYFVLGGVALCFFTPELPTQWRSYAAFLPWLGVGLLVVAVAYVLACVSSKHRHWRFRSKTIELPTACMALLQLMLATLNWMLIGSIIFILLQERIDYPTVMAVLLIAAVAGIVIHVPGGLGVIEAVFVTMLSSRLPATQLLASLLAYRSVYYLLPLAMAAVLYAQIEWRTQREA